MSNPRVVKRASGSCRGARRNRERRMYREKSERLQVLVNSLEILRARDKETIADLLERVKL